MALNPPFTIQIEKPEIELAATMAEMRTWLDKHMVTPIQFKIERTLTLPNITFAVQFRSEDEATLFERLFVAQPLDKRKLSAGYRPGEIAECRSANTVSPVFSAYAT